ncbi:divalent cation tolerance protein CutA [Streptomyces decoyicus]|uniref:divalent cation tolerance protein CutA n=1 Tax=Streptomyces decoyicus TaxID=249567 RepID=UPI0038709973|nr:divalent-cation tolerance protein CutA [Streptomyces decoyicus]
MPRRGTADDSAHHHARLVLKVRADRYDKVETHLLPHHPWQNPENSAVPIVAGADAYLHWRRRPRRRTDCSPEREHHHVMERRSLPGTSLTHLAVSPGPVGRLSCPGIR